MKPHSHHRAISYFVGEHRFSPSYQAGKADQLQAWFGFL
jgi:hypothetical protein